MQTSLEERRMIDTRLNIFISHAWKDKNLSVLKEIENTLQEKYDVWVDVKGVDYGETIDEKLVQAIERSDVVLTLWSQAAFQSKAVQFEIQTALNLKKIIVPCVVSNYSLDHSQKLRGRKYIDFYHDGKGISIALIQLTQFLLRLEMRDPRFEPVVNQVAALNEILEELEHIAYRIDKDFSGNENGDAYVQALMQLGKKMVQVSDKSTNEKQKTIRLFEKIQQISAQYPNPEQNDIKVRLLSQAFKESGI